MPTSMTLASGTAPVDWILERLERLCAFDTTTGREDAGLAALCAELEDLGARIERHEVEPSRHNVLATWGEPRLLFSTHLDTVPPYIAPRRDGGALWGRGTCDAKGQAVAQFAVIRELLRRGEGDLAWLGVVGEETDSCGSKRALALAPRFRGLRGAINGEPTQNKLATGQRGVQHLVLRTRGVAAHSGTPERGRSALWPLLEWLERLRAIPQAEHPDLGPEIWNLGQLSGGRAPNVVPDLGEAHLFVRALPGSTFEQRVRELAPECGSVESVFKTQPALYPRVHGFDHALVPFGSDAPRVQQLVPGGRVALVGPGSIEVAHSEREHVSSADLAAGHELLLALAKHFLALPVAAGPGSGLDSAEARA
ncbi:MAG: M20/M25/M40 family metallo-hydrolase [Planctomycetes bacterium]|nr:M20/M25/M40 family metallo-hydrolase [Planctomycetota bacterium]